MIRSLPALTAAALAAALATAPGIAAAQPKGCPPGLAKKHNGCTPPGQVGKGHRDRDHRYRVGDRLDGDYIVIRDPRRYGLDPDYTYARRDDTVFRIDRDTRAILDIIGGIATLAN